MVDANIKVKKEPLSTKNTTTHMHGWKTYAAAFIIAGGAAATALGHSEIARVLYAIGGAIGVVGLGHKIEKTANHG